MAARPEPVEGYVRPKNQNAMIKSGFYTYILLCNDKSYYVGHTDEIEKRIAQHQLGKVDSYTSTRLPIELIFLQIFGTRDEAWAAERKIKGWSRKKKELLINHGWEKLIKKQ